MKFKKGKHVLRRCNELSNYRLKMKSKERKVLDDYLPRPTKQIQFCILDFAWMNYRIRIILLHEHFRTGALWKKQKQIESVKIRPKTSWNMDIPSKTQTQSLMGAERSVSQPHVLLRLLLQTWVQPLRQRIFRKQRIKAALITFIYTWVLKRFQGNALQDQFVLKASPIKTFFSIDVWPSG